MNELSHGERVRFPVGVMRSVSFEKIKEGSLTTREQTNKENKKPTKPTAAAYEHLLRNKLRTSEQIKKAVTKKPLQ